MTLVPGTLYRVRFHGGHIQWRYIETTQHDGWQSKYGTFRINATKRHRGINLATGREVILKSTAKILGPINLLALPF